MLRNTSSRKAPQRTVKYTEEFQAESFAWLRTMRGPRFIRRLRRLVDQHGPEEALEQITHPTMSDELIEVHAAAIQRVAQTLTPLTG